MKVLNTRDIKKIKEILKSEYGFEFEKDYVFLKKEDDIFIMNKDIEYIDLSRIRVNNLGLYFGEHKGGIRLSREGCQIVGRKAVKGIIEINEKQARAYFDGEDIKMEGEGYIIVKFRDDILGPGVIKKGVMLNYLSKEHRTNVIF